MKIFLFIFFFPLFVFSQSDNYEVKNQTAEVERIFELYVFVNSKPIKPYTSLGKEFIYPMIRAADFEELRDNAIRKIKKKYPHAQGVILTFTSPNLRTDGHTIAEPILWE